MKIQEIIFKIKSQLKNFEPKILENERPTSYPYVSGDTFRAICDICIENDQDLNLFIIIINTGVKIKTLFISLSYIHKNENYIINKLKSVNSINLSTIKLILHNGDLLPDSLFFEFLEKLFRKIYCVNVINESDRIIPIPIGLENYHYFRNGKLEVFKTFNGIFPGNDKNIIVSSCFNVATNYKKRKEIFDILKNSKVCCISGNLSRDEYIKLIKKSLFTISPPGNGNDCHRTWEAIYLNTVPVVLNGFLSKFMCENLPIYSVDSYAEILEKNDDQLIKIYFDLIERRSNAIAYFDYWQYEILVND